MKRAKDSTGPPPPDLPLWKKALISGVLVLAFFATLETLAALCGIRPPPPDTDPFVGFAGNNPLFRESKGSDGAILMETAPGKVGIFNLQRFPRRKAPRAYRIFCMGGSTTFGRPYDDAASFCGWLREFLPTADPGRKWELINAGGISYASYRVALLMEELAGYEPDLFIVYSGHNEFLERRTYGALAAMPRPLLHAAVLMSRTRIYAAGKRILSAAGGRKKDRAEGSALLPAEVDALLDRSAGPASYTRSIIQRERTLAHYRYDLERMADIARSGGAKTLFITPASNLKDCPPFKSEHPEGLTAADLRRFDEALTRAKEARSRLDPEGALKALDEAAGIDSRYAGLQYQRGQVLLDLKRYDEAKAALRLARDEDVCPLRAPGEFLRTVTEVAARKGAPVVDFAAMVEARSPNGIPGAGLFWDHVHLSSAGYRMLGLRIMEELARMGVLQPEDSWDAAALAAATRRVEGRIDRKAQGKAMRNLALVLFWTGRVEQAGIMARKSLELSGGDPYSHIVLGDVALRRGDAEEAARDFRQALAIDPDHVDANFRLGLALQAQEKTAAAIAQFRKTLSIAPRHPPALTSLGVELGKSGRWEDAIALFEDSLRLDPRSAVTNYNLGLALTRVGRLPEAVRRLREALRILPDHAQAHNELGNVLAAQGKLGEAERHLREALRIRPEFADAHSQLGRVLAAQGKTGEAVRHFREALRIDPQHPWARRNLEQAL